MILYKPKQCLTLPMSGKILVSPVLRVDSGFQIRTFEKKISNLNLHNVEKKASSSVCKDAFFCRDKTFLAGNSMKDANLSLYLQSTVLQMSKCPLRAFDWSCCRTPMLSMYHASQGHFHDRQLLLALTRQNKHYRQRSL